MDCLDIAAYVLLILTDFAQKVPKLLHAQQLDEAYLGFAFVVK